MTEAKTKTLTSYDDAAAFVQEQGCGSCTHRPGEPGEGEMYWRISNHDPAKLIEVVKAFKAGGFKIKKQETQAVKEQPISRIPNGAYYIDVPFTYEKDRAPGDRPRILLVRGK